jgi:glucose-6-phosphate-specific signal transduction histidine kinase
MLETEGLVNRLVRDALDELNIPDDVRILLEEFDLNVVRPGQDTYSISRRWKVKIEPIPYDEKKIKEFTLITDSFNHINDAKAFIKQQIQ